MYNDTSISILTINVGISILALELDITLPSLFTMDNGFTLTIALYDQQPPTRSPSVNLIFCFTCGKSFPFHLLCDVVSPVSPVLMIRASTTMTMRWRRSKRIRAQEVKNDAYNKNWPNWRISIQRNYIYIYIYIYNFSKFLKEKGRKQSSSLFCFFCNQFSVLLNF